MLQDSKNVFDPFVYDSAPDSYKNSEMCDKIVSKNVLCWNIAVIDRKPKKYVIKLSILLCQR